MSDTRLPLPDYVKYPIFPFEGDLRVKVPLERMAADLPRSGEGGRPCDGCGENRNGFDLWSDGFWRVRGTGQLNALSALVFLETVPHLDFGDLDDEQAASYGRITVRLENIMMALPDVGRVHINKWGDGGSHFHVWFMARPRGVFELYGYGDALWDQVLPPVAAEVRDANYRQIARTLAQVSGTALV